MKVLGVGNASNAGNEKGTAVSKTVAAYYGNFEISDSEV
jgi:hypothetical protein|tara:strand:- start:86 stop:202 length:117 start_codon:yes stop_codon:yes gene_type:complete